MKYEVEGIIKIQVSIDDIEADSEEGARIKFKQQLIDNYHLDCFGLPHNPKNGVSIELDAFEQKDN